MQAKADVFLHGGIGIIESNNISCRVWNCNSKHKTHRIDTLRSVLNSFSDLISPTFSTDNVFKFFFRFSNCFLIVFLSCLALSARVGLCTHAGVVFSDGFHDVACTVRSSWIAHMSSIAGSVFEYAQCEHSICEVVTVPSSVTIRPAR